MSDVAKAAKAVMVWGIPLVPWTLQETVVAVSDRIRSREPGFFITANVHYAMLSEQHPDLREINERAAFILADGKPLVWAARLAGSPIPERVAGSDLIFRLCEEAARQQFGVYLLGGGEGVADKAAERLVSCYPGLRIVGTACPPFGERTPEQEAAIVAAVREAAPDLLITAFTMPRGERWIAAHLEALEVPVVVNLGASLDFAAGRVRRAPRWMQKSGLEWLFRMAQEPRRLAGRYARNAWFVARKLIFRFQ